MSMNIIKLSRFEARKVFEGRPVGQNLAIGSRELSTPFFHLRLLDANALTL